MKIAVIGHGFVGKAVSFAFTIPSNTVQIIDPIYNSHISELDEDTHFAFVCVPTPMGCDGSIDADIVRTCVKEVVERAPHAIIVLKSTVTPGVVNDLASYAYAGPKLVYNPEFLTEANYIEDFKNQNRIIVGGPRPATTKVKRVFSKAFPKVPIIKTGSTIAEMVKYFLNSFIEKEACPNNLAPTNSTTAQLVIGDALAVCLLEYRGFSSEDFAKIEYNNIYRTIEDNDNRIAREIENIYRTIDSRVDKLDDRLSKEIQGLDHTIHSSIDNLERHLSTNK